MIVDSASLVQNLLRQEKQASVSLSHDKTNNLSSFLERTYNMLRVGDKVVYLQAENEPSYGIIKKIHSPKGQWEAEVAFVSTLLNVIIQRCRMLAFNLSTPLKLYIRNHHSLCSTLSNCCYSFSCICNIYL